MKLRYINPHNVAHLIPRLLAPPFAVAKILDELLCERPELRPTRLPSFDELRPCVDYWIIAKPDKNGRWVFEVCVQGDDAFATNPEGATRQAFMCTGMLIIDNPPCQLTVPLGHMFRGAPSLENTHTLYVHSVTGDGPHNYAGITRRTWYERFAQHRSEAMRGSKLLFHRAIRDRGVNFTRVACCGLTYEQAMNMEEHYTMNGTLYPHGLNMIPGGFAGMRYLGSLGHQASTIEQRDAAMACIMERERLLDGSPNPLCAARWASDQEYVNSVICGHSGRLNVAQIRNILMLSASGYDAPAIAGIVGDSTERVRRVAENKRYSRVT